MSGLFTVTVQEARGLVAVPANVDAVTMVIGCSSAGSGLSPFFLSGQAAIANRGYGDAVDALTQVIEQVQPDGGTVKIPAAMYTVPGTTTGSYGTIDVTGKTGLSVVTVDTATHPYGTYEAYLKVVTGGTVGTPGITLQWSLDNGRTLSQVTALGSAVNFLIPNANVQFDFTSASLVAGDVIKCRTFAPAPTGTDLDTAFTALANSTADFGLVVCEFPMSSTLITHVTTGQSALRSRGKRAMVVFRTRLPTFETSETESVWAAAVEAEYSGYTDSTLHGRATYGLLTDAMTGRQYLRSDLAQYAADLARVPRRRVADVPADRNTANFTLVDGNGATVGHDEGPRGAVTGLSDDTQGNRFGCNMRFPDTARREEVFSTVPWVLYASDERIRNVPVRRIANAMERVAVSAGTSRLGDSDVFYIPASPSNGNQNTLTAASRAALHDVIFRALSVEFADDIQNAKDAALDTGLVQVSSVITVTGGNLLTIPVTIAPRVKGILLNLPITLAIQE